MVARLSPKSLKSPGFSRFKILNGTVLGGDEGARTPDLDSAIVALSQLSYIPGQTRS